VVLTSVRIPTLNGGVAVWKALNDVRVLGQMVRRETFTFGNAITRHLRKHVFLPPGLRGEHAPRTVIVPEEKKSNRTVRSQCLNAYITPPIRG
jgi:hypothetical protein